MISLLRLFGSTGLSLKKYGISTLLFWLLAIAPALALELRVAIETGVSAVNVGSSTNATVRDANGEVLGQVAGMNGFRAENRNKGIALNRWQTSAIWIEPQSDGYVYIGDRWYRGRTLLAATGDGIAAINYVDLEEYLYSVVGAEVNPSWPLEALKAQAVAARSYALYQRETRGNSLYDVGDTQRWQVYNGVSYEANSTKLAVEATRGEILAHNGQIAEAVFHAASGGHTENVEDIWTEPKAYLRGVPDFDAGTPAYAWTKTLSRQELGNIVGVRNPSRFTIERQTPQGRVISMKIAGDSGEVSVTGDRLRSSLGLRSTLFRMRLNGDRVEISGRGFGHGVGLSQWGAFNMAGQGYSYLQILAHYYRNAGLAELP